MSTTYLFETQKSYNILAETCKKGSGIKGTEFINETHSEFLTNKYLLLHHESGITVLVSMYCQNRKPAVTIAGGDNESHRLLNSELEKLTGDKLTKI